MTLPEVVEFLVYLAVDVPDTKSRIRFGTGC